LDTLTVHAGKIDQDLHTSKAAFEMIFQITGGFMQAFLGSKLPLQGLAKLVEGFFELLP
jgi:hypothetical protein